MKQKISRRQALFGLAAGGVALATPNLALAALRDWQSPHSFTLQLWNLQRVRSLDGIISRVGDDQEGALDELYRRVNGKLSIDGGPYPMEQRRVVTNVWAWNLKGVERTVLCYDQANRSGAPSERKVQTITDTSSAPPLEIKGRGKGLYRPHAGWQVVTRGPQALASLVFDKRQFNIGQDYRNDIYFLICREAGPHLVAPHRDSIGVHVLPKNIAVWAKKPSANDRKWKVPRIFG